MGINVVFQGKREPCRPGALEHLKQGHPSNAQTLQRTLSAEIAAILLGLASLARPLNDLWMIKGKEQTL